MLPTGGSGENENAGNGTDDTGYIDDSSNTDTTSTEVKRTADNLIAKASSETLYSRRQNPKLLTIKRKKALNKSSCYIGSRYEKSRKTLSFDDAKAVDLTTPNKYIIKENGRKSYSINNKQCDRLELPKVSDWTCSYNLPYGYEVAFDQHMKVYFINHNDATVSDVFPDEDVFTLFTDQNTYMTNVYDKFACKIKNKASGEFGIEIVHLTKSTFVVSHVDQNSSARTKVYPGDIVLTINTFIVVSLDEINKLLKNSSEVTLELYRRKRLLNNTHFDNATLKSSRLSKERKELLRIRPLSVQFSDIPIAITYKNNLEVSNVMADIEKRFKNIIRIKLETGVVKAVKIDGSTTVGMIVNELLSKNGITHHDMYTLGLVSVNSDSFRLFKKNALATELLKQKIKNYDWESRILMISPPLDIKSLSAPEYHNDLDYLFHQVQNLFLSGKFVVKNERQSKRLFYMMVFSKLAELLVDAYKKLKRFVQPQVKKKYNLNNVLKTALNSENILGIDCKLQLMYRSINADDLLREVKETFILLVPSDIRQLVFADVAFLDKINFVMDEEKYGTLRSLLNNIQISFLEAAIYLQIFHFYKFSVNVVVANKIKISYPEVIGTRFNFFLKANGDYGLEKNATEITVPLGNVKNLLGAIVTYNCDGKKLLSLYRKCKCPLIMICNTETCSNIILLISKMYKIFYKSISGKLLCTIDLTDKMMRVDQANLLTYSDPHFTLPAGWNHATNTSRFFELLRSHFLRNQVAPFDEWPRDYKVFKDNNFNGFIEVFSSKDDLPNLSDVDKNADAKPFEEDLDIDMKDCTKLFKKEVLADEYDLKRSSKLFPSSSTRLAITKKSNIVNRSKTTRLHIPSFKESQCESLNTVTADVDSFECDKSSNLEESSSKITVKDQFPKCPMKKLETKKLQEM